MKLTTKILLYISSLAVLVFAVVTVFVSIYSAGLVKDISYSHASEISKRCALELGNQLEVALHEARSLASAMSEYRGVSVDQRRQLYKSIVKGVFSKNKDFIAVFSVWEPGVMDGRDGQFSKGKYDGRFYTSWNRADNVVVEKRETYYDPNTEDFYSTPKLTKKDFISEPYRWKYNQGGKEYFEVTISVPVLVDGAFVGIVGFDITLDAMQHLVDNIKGFDNSYAYLVSSKGALVVHPIKELIGKKLSDVDAERTEDRSIMESIQKGVFISTHKKAMKGGVPSQVFVTPIHLGNSDSYWGLAFSVPHDVVLKDAYTMRYITLWICIVGLVVFLIVIYGISRNIAAVINTLIAETDKLIKAALQGNLSARSNPEQLSPEFQPIVDGINQILDAALRPLNEASVIIKHLARGEMTSRIELSNYKGDYKELMESLNAMHSALEVLLEQTGALTTSAVNGDWAARCNAGLLSGAYSKVLAGVNDALEALTNPLSTTAICLDRIAKGDLPPLLEVDYKGDFNKIKNSLNLSISSIQSLVRSTNDFISFAQEGQLSEVNFDESNFEGAYRKIISGLSKAARTVEEPLREINLVLNNMSKGDLTAKVESENKGIFRMLQVSVNNAIDAEKDIIEKARKISGGDFRLELSMRSENDELMRALNGMMFEMDRIIGEFVVSLDQIAEMSQQMNDTAQLLASGANEQAASTEEVASSIEQMQASIFTNTDNARQTEAISNKVASEIIEGNLLVGRTVQTMMLITHKIAVVNEIARKTDFLAINAAIEASRAKEHGKGFSVVATEVRKLAEKSQQAASEIDEVSRNSVVIAEESGSKLKLLVPDVQKTAQLVQEISLASSEQANAANQINAAIQSLNTVTQQNASSADRMALGSEILSKQASRLLSAISFFKLRNVERKVRPATTDTMIMRNTAASQKKTTGVEINLDDELDDGFVRM